MRLVRLGTRNLLITLAVGLSVLAASPARAATAGSARDLSLGAYSVEAHH